MYFTSHYVFVILLTCEHDNHFFVLDDGCGVTFRGRYCGLNYSILVRRLQHCSLFDQFRYGANVVPVESQAFL